MDENSTRNSETVMENTDTLEQRKSVDNNLGVNKSGAVEHEQQQKSRSDISSMELGISKKRKDAQLDLGTVKQNEFNKTSQKKQRLSSDMEVSTGAASDKLLTSEPKEEPVTNQIKQGLKSGSTTSNSMLEKHSCKSKKTAWSKNEGNETSSMDDEEFEIPRITKHYKSVYVLADIARVSPCEDTVRSMSYNGPNKNPFAKLFRNPALYGDDGAYISVFIPRMETEKMKQLIGLVGKATRKEEFNIHNEGQVILQRLQVQIVDGTRRAAALRQPSVLSKVDGSLNVKVRLYYRVDFHPMEVIDALFIGGLLNWSTKHAAPMSTIDRVYMVNSYLRQLKYTDMAKRVALNSLNNSELTNSVLKMQRDVQSLKSADIYCMCNCMGLLPGIGESQKRVLCTVIRGVYQFHDERHSEKVIFPFLTAISLKVLMNTIIWDSQSLDEQVFILRGIRDLFPKQMPMTREMNKMPRRHVARARAEWSETRPKTLTTTHYSDVTLLLRRLWLKVSEKLFKSSSEENAKAPWELLSDTRRVCPEDIIEMLTNWTVNELLDIASTNRNTDLFIECVMEYLEDWIRGVHVQEYKTPEKADSNPVAQEVQRLKKTRKAEKLSQEDEHSQNDDVPEKITGKIEECSNGSVEKVTHRSKRARKIQESSDDEESNNDVILPVKDVVNSLHKSDKETPRMLKACVPSVAAGPELQCGTTTLPENVTCLPSHKNVGVKSATLCTPESMTHKSEAYMSVCTPDSVSKRLSFPAVDENSEWAKSKDIVSNARVLNKPRGEECVENGKKVDENGFYITHRTNGSVAWKPPKLRVDGFHNLRKETLEDYSNSGFTPHPSELWWKGDLPLMGCKSNVTMRLFDDSDYGFSSINPEFKLTETLEELHPDIMVPHLFPKMEQHVESIEDIQSSDVQVILRALGFRPPHRTFIAGFSLKDYNVCRKSLVASMFLHTSCLSKVLTQRLQPPAAELESRVLLDGLPSLLSMHFKGLRARLDSSGLVVLNNLFRSFRGNSESKQLPFDRSVFEQDSLASNASSFFSFWEKTIPSVSEMKSRKCKAEHYLLWSGIRNTVKDEEEQVTECSRLMQTKYASCAYYEEKEKVKERIPVLDSKNFIETAIMQVATWLRLAEKSWDDWKSDTKTTFELFKARGMSAPDTGGRLIATASTETPTQVPHRDTMFSAREVISNDGSSSQPPYFCMVTYEDYTPLWVLEGSHRYLHLPLEQMKQLGKILPLRLIYIPPWSLIVVRGDLIHAGAGGIESKGNRVLRFHLYILRKGTPFGDNIDEYAGKYFTCKTSDIQEELLKRIREL